MKKEQLKKLVRNLLKEDASRLPLKLSDVDPEVAKVVTTTGLKDGDPNDDKIPVKAAPTGVAPVQKLNPSQSSMNIQKAMTFVLHMIDHADGKMDPGGDLGAFISKDGYIMDGHHRWIATAMVDPSKQVGGFKVDMPGQQLVAILNAMTKGRFGEMTGKAASGGFDQFKEAPIRKQLYAMVKGGISKETAPATFKGWQKMTPEGVLAGLEAFTGKKGKDAVEAAVTKMVNNLNGINMATPTWAPERPDMPVIDEPNVPTAVKALSGGEVDWKKPTFDQTEKTPAAANRKDKISVTEDFIRKVVSESIKKTKTVREAFRMEKDFKKGMPVSWNSLEKVTKTTASGREKVDYDRVSRSGTIVGLETAGAGHNVPGYAIVQDDAGKKHDVDLTELTPA